MEPFESSLLREKFVITDPGRPSEPPVVALSNRMQISFANEKEQERETFIVRAQNMHCCVRFAAAIAREIAERGPITYRVSDFRWDSLWKDVVRGYEEDWNPSIWVALYMNGRVLYQQGPHHPFLDIIEQCEVHNQGGYAEALPFAEKIFSQAGKTVKISNDSNVALIVTVKPTEAKSGIMLRSATKKMTFSYRAQQKEGGDILRVATVLSICAAYLEGIQLAFQVGMLNRKFDIGLIEKFSDEYRRRERTTQRVASLNRGVLQFDKDFVVTYRPEQPDFQRHIAEAEAFALQVIHRTNTPETA